jgi:hypothetical protein
MHNMLLKEEARAIVVKVEPELGELEGEEEFYVTSLEDLNQHNSSKGKGEESERETQSPVDSEVEGLAFDNRECQWRSTESCILCTCCTTGDPP